MVVDLSKMDLKELKALRKKVDAAITSYDENTKREARLAVEELARQHGFSLSELATVKKPRAKRAPSKVLYKNPKNAEQTWTGRGRKPKWVEEALASGKSLKSLEAK